MALRPTVLRLHLILGLTAGLLLSVVTLSGAAVVFRPELDWLHADRAGLATERVAGLDDTAAVLRERWPKARIQRLLTAAGSGAGDEWWLRDGTESWKAFTDPATGRLLGHTRDSAVSGLLAWLARFHHNLWLGEIGGILVGSSGLCLLGFIATGLWLWWPGILRLGAGLRRIGLHTRAGLLGSPLLAFLAVTGCMFEFRWMRSAVHYGLGGTQADRPLALRPRPTDAPTGDGSTIDFRQAIGVAEKAAPGTALSVMPPRRDGGTWNVLLDYAGNAGSFSGVLVQVAADGTPALVLDPRRMSPGGWMNAQLWGLHTGAWAGGWSKTLHLVGGLLPTLLLCSGLAIWLRRRAQAASVRPPA